MCTFCPPFQIEPKSLAGTSGLRDGDRVEELQYEIRPSYERMLELLNSPNELELIVVRR